MYKSISVIQEISFRAEFKGNGGIPEIFNQANQWLRRSGLCRTFEKT